MAIFFLPLLILILILSGLPGNSSVKTFRYLSRRYGGSVAIPCFYEHKQKDYAKYWCTAKDWQSCTMLDCNETERRIGHLCITDSPDELAFYLPMSDLQWSDSRDYWCAVEINGTVEFSENLYLRVTNAQSVRTESWVSAPRGGSVTISCYYDQMYKHYEKYWCRGYHWAFCSILARSGSNQMTGKVSIRDDPAHLVFNVTMRDLQDEDADTYWCAIWINVAADPAIFLPLIIRSRNVKGTLTSSTQIIPGKGLPAGPPTASSTGSTESSSSQLVLLLTMGLLLLLVILLAIVIGAVLNRRGKRPANNDDTQNRLTNIPSADPKDAMIYSTVTLQDHEINWQVSLQDQRRTLHGLASEDPGGLIVYSTLVLKQT